VKSADESPSAGADRDELIAALCEIATATGMTRFVDDLGEIGWINPRSGAAATLDQVPMVLREASVVPDGPARAATPATLVGILGVESIELPGGDRLFSAGGRMMVQTAGGALRPAELKVAGALGPGGGFD